jgi:hypothetical protein
MASKPKRNYKKETEWENQPAQVAKRVARNRARRLMERRGLVHKGDGKEVDHKRMLATGGSKTDPRNLRVVSRSTNRKKQPKHKGKNLHRLSS